MLIVALSVLLVKLQPRLQLPILSLKLLNLFILLRVNSIGVGAVLVKLIRLVLSEKLVFAQYFLQSMMERVIF